MDHHGTAALEVAVGFCPAEPSQNPAANLQVPKSFANYAVLFDFFKFGINHCR